METSKSCSEGNDGMMIGRIGMAAALLLFAAPAFAQSAADEGQASCPETPVVAAPWSGWARPGKVVAGSDAGAAPALVPGKALGAALHPAAHVAFAAAPARPPADGSHAGLFRLTLDAPARIGVALSAGAWVDVVTDKALVASAGHGHGPACSGIRKIVWFPLAAGTHIVQIANAAAAEIEIMAVSEPVAAPAAEGHSHYSH
jgi:hypothetical protein